jgi:hypothetical protein
VYFDWQLPFAIGCAVFFVLLGCTLLLHRLIALWRPLLMISAGLGLTAMLVLVDWQKEGHMNLLRFRQVGQISFPWVQLWICTALAVGSTVLSIGDIWFIVANRKRGVDLPEAK